MVRSREYPEGRYLSLRLLGRWMDPREVDGKREASYVILYSTPLRMYTQILLYYVIDRSIT